MGNRRGRETGSTRTTAGGRPSTVSAIREPTSRETIGRYRLCFELASGGMARVYLAQAQGTPGFEKLVALKRIHPHLVSETSYLEMFLDEARIASRITHPNVCSVFDFGEADGEYFIAMEYLVGEPLSRVHRRVIANVDERDSPLLPARMAHIIAQACEGLHAAHELRDADGKSLEVVHRDVSAENLFITYDGTTQVVDFGIAHASQRLHHTEAGQVKGTFPYMAPEQMTAAPVDRRVDVWALGAVLWELLTQRRLFLRDTDVNTMYAVLSSEVKPPSEYNSEVSKELDDVVLRALQRNPDQRWQTAREMGTALRRAIASREDPLGPAEIADWMKVLFPDGESRKRRVMEIARSSEAWELNQRRDHSDNQLGERPVSIPRTARRRRQAAPRRSPPALIVVMIAGATVLTLVALEWLRQ